MTDKVIDIEERIPKLRDRRKKRTNRKFLALLILLLILLALLIYNQSPYSKIQEITVSGEELFGKDVYLDASGLKAGESMWSFNPESVQEDIQQLEWVKTVEVKRNWLTTVEIDIEEYEQVGFLEEQDQYRILLANGYTASVENSLVNGPLLSGFEEESRKKQLAAQLAKLEPEVHQLLSEAFQPQPEERPAAVTLYMNDGNEVHVLMSSLAENLNRYPAIASQLPPGQKGVIDAEVGIFFQPYTLPDGTLQGNQTENERTDLESGQ